MTVSLFLINDIIGFSNVWLCQIVEAVRLTVIIFVDSADASFVDLNLLNIQLTFCFQQFRSNKK